MDFFVAFEKVTGIMVDYEIGVFPGSAARCRTETFNSSRFVTDVGFLFLNCYFFKAWKKQTIVVASL